MHCILVFNVQPFNSIASSLCSYYKHGVVENQQGRIPETPILIDAILTRHPWASVWFHTVACVFYPYLLCVQLQHAENHATVDQGCVVPGTPQRDCHLPKGPGAEDNGKYRRLARCVVIYSAPSNGLMLPLLCEFIFCVSLLSLQMPNCFDSVRQQGSCYLAKFPVNWCARKRNAGWASSKAPLLLLAFTGAHWEHKGWGCALIFQGQGSHPFSGWCRGWGEEREFCLGYPSMF